MINFIVKYLVLVLVMVGIIGLGLAELGLMVWRHEAVTRYRTTITPKIRCLLLQYRKNLRRFLRVDRMSALLRKSQDWLFQ